MTKTCNRIIVALLGLAVLSVRGQEQRQSLAADLISAIREGDVAKSRILLAVWKTTRKPWPLDPDDKPLLFLAIQGREKGHPEVIELLLAEGANVHAKGPWGMTALHWAAWRGYAERTEQILKHGAKLEATDDFGRTPLLLAISLAAEKLIAAGANVLAVDRNGNNALHYAAEAGARHLSIVFNAGFKVIDARNNAGLTPLHYAAVSASTGGCGWLLDHGARIDAVTSARYDYLPLDFYPGLGNETRVPAGSTPLSIALRRHKETKWSSGRYRAVVDLLKARGAKAHWRPPPFLQFAFVAFACASSITFFAGILFVDSRMTGWHALARKFPAANEPTSGLNTRQNGGVGIIGLIYLRNLMRTAATDSGLYLAFPRFLRAWHPPLLVPWSELHLVSNKTLFGVRIVRLEVGNPRIARIFLRGGVAKVVADRVR